MIKNLTRDKEIVEKHHILEGVMEKGFGLMFRPKTNDGYIFEFARPITLNFHTYFMFFNIDIVFLDENKRVLKVERNVKPYDNVVGKNFKYAIELASHKANQVQKGDLIDWS